MSIGKTYRRLNKAIRLAQSGEADSIVAAAHEILEARIKNGSALCSPGAVRDYLRLLLQGREHEVFVVVLLNAQNRLIATEELKWIPISRQQFKLRAVQGSKKQ